METKKILIIEASLRKGYSQQYANRIAESVSLFAATEQLSLRQLNINPCSGCCLCLSKGSAHCPFHSDDVQLVLSKMTEADGLIIVVPNYSLQVTGLLKMLLDRLAFVFHRPRLFGKTFMPIVVQGVYGGGKITKYLNEVMEFWGMKATKGAVLTGGIHPNAIQPAAVAKKNETAMEKAIGLFKKELFNTKPKSPTLFRMMIFRSTRSSMMYFEETLEPDRKYYEDNGWNRSYYYYKVSKNPVVATAGFMVDRLIRNMAAKGNRE